MFRQSSLKCSLHGFACVDEFSPPINCVNSFVWRCNVFGKRMCRATLEFLNQLGCKRLIEFKEEIMFVAHRILSFRLLCFWRPAPFSLLALGLQLFEVLWAAFGGFFASDPARLSHYERIGNSFTTMRTLHHVPILLWSLGLSSVIIASEIDGSYSLTYC